MDHHLATMILIPLTGKNVASRLRKQELRGAALIKAVFEVDPLKCPKCGGIMKIVAFIEEDDAIRKILKHCNLWKEHAPRPPPHKTFGPGTEVEPYYDFSFIEPA